MSREVIRAGLDIGSSQAVVVIGQCDPEKGKITVLGAGCAPCRGLKGGVVVNIPESKVGIARAVEEAEEAAQETVHGLVVGVRGSHIETFNHRGAITISRTDKEITPDDVEQVIINAKAIQLSSDREILHTVPQDFALDKQSGVEDPIGMEGSHLAVDVHIAVGSSNHISNIVKAINQAGFSTQDLVYGTYAVSDAVVSEEEKELGAALLDLGGQTSHLSVFADGVIKYTKELPIGGELITKDIAYGLKTSFATAQMLKEKFGMAMVRDLDTDEKIEYISIDGRSREEVSRRNLGEIIQSRIEEIFELVHEELVKSNYDEMIPGGLVLTGGCSKLVGLDKAAEEIFRMNAHLGQPLGIEGPAEIVLNPVYSTAISLLKYRHSGEWFKLRRSNGHSSAISKVKDWLEQVF